MAAKGIAFYSEYWQYVVIGLRMRRALDSQFAIVRNVGFPVGSRQLQTDSMSMRGIKLLFFAIWDEFKTLIFLQALTEQDVESPSDDYCTKGVCGNTPRRSMWGSEFPISNCKKNRPYQKWYQTKDGRDRCMRRLVEIFTIAAVVVYLFQMQANRRQADAAEQQLKDIRDAQRLDERAWVVAIGGYMDPSGIPVVQFRNTGKTPGVDVSAFLGRTLDPNSIPKRDKFTDKKDSIFSGLLSPGADASVGLTYDPVDPSTVKAIETIKLPYFVYGTVWYDDIFGQHHWSQFCYLITSTGSGRFHFLTFAVHTACDDVKNDSKN